MYINYIHFFVKNGTQCNKHDLVFVHSRLAAEMRAKRPHNDGKNNIVFFYIKKQQFFPHLFLYRFFS